MPRSLSFSSAVSSCSCLSPILVPSPIKARFSPVRLSPNKSRVAREQEPKVFSTPDELFYEGIAFENLLNQLKGHRFNQINLFCLHPLGPTVPPRSRNGSKLPNHLCGQHESSHNLPMGLGQSVVLILFCWENTVIGVYL